MHIIQLALASILALSSFVSGDLTCTSYKPVGWKSNKARINWFNNNPSGNPAEGPGFPAPTLPANASVGNPWLLAGRKNGTTTGYPFIFRSCNSTSLQLTSPSTQSSCSHGGCYITYTNYVQVINPATGNCLTATAWNTSLSGFSFKPCQKNPTNAAQLYETDQQVLYSPNYGSITSYGTVNLNNVLLFWSPDTQPYDTFLAWTLDRLDNKTIQVKQYDYTQDGLSAQLLQA